MKFLHLACLSSILALAACSNGSEYSSQTEKANAPAAIATKQETAVEAPATSKAPEYVKAEDVKKIASSSDATVASSAPVPAATLEAAASETINASNLSAAQKTEMNAQVTQMIAAKGNPVAMAAAGSALVGLAGGPFAGKVGGFALLDPAAAVAAVQDLIAAIMDADPAGIQDAIMDLIAALAA